MKRSPIDLPSYLINIFATLQHIKTWKNMKKLAAPGRKGSIVKKTNFKGDSDIVDEISGGLSADGSSQLEEETAAQKAEEEENNRQAEILREQQLEAERVEQERRRRAKVEAEERERQKVEQEQQERERSEREQAFRERERTERERAEQGKAAAVEARERAAREQAEEDERAREAEERLLAQQRKVHQQRIAEDERRRAQEAEAERLRLEEEERERAEQEEYERLLQEKAARKAEKKRLQELQWQQEEEERIRQEELEAEAERLRLEEEMAALEAEREEERRQEELRVAAAVEEAKRAAREKTSNDAKLRAAEDQRKKREAFLNDMDDFSFTFEKNTKTKEEKLQQTLAKEDAVLVGDMTSASSAYKPVIVSATNKKDDASISYASSSQSYASNDDSARYEEVAVAEPTPSVASKKAPQSNAKFNEIASSLFSSDTSQSTSKDAAFDDILSSASASSTGLFGEETEVLRIPNRSLAVNKKAAKAGDEKPPSSANVTETVTTGSTYEPVKSTPSSETSKFSPAPAQNNDSSIRHPQVRRVEYEDDEEDDEEEDETLSKAEKAAFWRAKQEDLTVRRKGIDAHVYINIAC
jgi:hypothetical protein